MGLPAGHYKLCVRMLNDDGTMGDTESQLDITIKGTWYTSWWAILLYLLLIVLAIWLVWTLRVKRQQLQDDKESIEELKQDISSPEEEEIEEAILMDDDN